LEDVLQILPDPTEVIERSYIIGSGVALSSHRLSFFNKSSNMSLLIDLSASSPVSFKTITGENISSFELASRTQRQVDICFTTTELDTADEGLNRAIATIQINAGTVSLVDGNDQIRIGGDLTQLIDDQTIGPNTGPVPPPSVNITSEDQIELNTVIVPPQDTAAAPIRIIVDSVEQPSQLINGVRVGKAFVSTTMRMDDPTLYSYTWNFDVLGQGSGIGSSSQSTNVTWVMTENDLRLLESDGKTSRTVEVVARKGNSIYRSTKEIILQDSMLGSVMEVNLDEQTIGSNTGPVLPPTGGGRSMINDIRTS